GEHHGAAAALDQIAGLPLLVVGLHHIVQLLLGAGRLEHAGRVLEAVHAEGARRVRHGEGDHAARAARAAPAGAPAVAAGTAVVAARAAVVTARATALAARPLAARSLAAGVAA